MTRSQTVAADIAALLRARNPLLVIVTKEEARAERYIIEACAAANYIPRVWDCAAGVRNIDRTPFRAGSNDPGETLDAIRNFAEGGSDRQAWIMRDLHQWLVGPVGIQTSRQLRNLARTLPTTDQGKAQAVIMITPTAELPPELQGHATVIDWPLPDREEIASILDAAIRGLPEEMRAAAAPNGQRDQAIDAAIGLSGEEAAACYARSLVQTRAIAPAMVAKEKQRVIARERVLEIFEPLKGGLDAVGGLDVLKSWLKTRTMAYSARARAYGVVASKGCLLVGVPGCGKSLTAKAIAAALGVPLIRVDLGALKSKFVGESEGNLRRAFKVIEAMGRCVVWLDEIEKALAGATQGAADGGVSSDALGAILSWMQDRQGEAFVVATANDVTSLPPELLRKGRFDELFFVDLPNFTERVAITAATLRQYDRQDVAIDCGTVAAVTEGFTGAEIAALVPDALFTGFADGEREIATQDLVDAARNVVPLSKTAAEKIKRLREWAQGRARYATTAETATQARESVRALDLDPSPELVAMAQAQWKQEGKL